MNKNSYVKETDTDLYLNLLADSTKIKPMDFVINNKPNMNESENDSFMIDKDAINSNEKNIKIIECDENQSNSSISSIKQKQMSYKQFDYNKKHSEIKQSNIFAFNDNVEKNKTESSETPVKKTEKKIEKKTEVYENIKVESKNEQKVPFVLNVENNVNDERYQKMECLSKLLFIKEQGIELTKKFDMNSKLEDMQIEIKYHSDIQNKKSGIILCKSIFINSISAIEFLNERYDPFGFKLNGWSSNIRANAEQYDSVICELMEKYKASDSKMEPELKLLFMVIASGASHHLSKILISNPIIGDTIKNNPDILNKIQSSINQKISPPKPSETDKINKLYETIVNSNKKNNQMNVNELLNKIKPTDNLTESETITSISVDNAKLSSTQKKQMKNNLQYNKNKTIINE